MSDRNCLLFDLDGTLLDTHDIILTSMRHTLNGIYGLQATDEELMAGVGTPLLDQMMHFTKGDEAKAEELVALYREHNDATHDAGVHAYPNAAQALQMLKDAGYRMSVVTSKRHFMAQRGLEITGLYDFFEFVIGSDDWSEHKPEPGCILHCMDLMNVKSADCFYIGDSPFDMQAGNAAGCVTIAALWGMFPKEALEANNPDREASSIMELAKSLTT